jgi:hypothetical protein
MLPDRLKGLAGQAKSRSVGRPFGVLQNNLLAEIPRSAPRLELAIATRNPVSATITA